MAKERDALGLLPQERRRLEALAQAVDSVKGDTKATTESILLRASKFDSWITKGDVPIRAKVN